MRSEAVADAVMLAEEGQEVSIELLRQGLCSGRVRRTGLRSLSECRLLILRAASVRQRTGLAKGRTSPAKRRTGLAKRCDIGKGIYVAVKGGDEGM